MSLSSLAASPLILGTDLTNLDPTDLKYLTNRAVLSVDQDAIDASRITSTSTTQVFAKTEKNGDVVVGLFNTGSQSQVVSTTAAAVGLPAASAYQLNNLWTHQYLPLRQQDSVSEPVTVSPPVQAPYKTYSSATDTPAAFAQSGQEFGISGAGADLYNDADAYSTIYLPGAAASTATIETKVVSTASLTGFGKAGIVVRNDMTGSGPSPEGVILFASPSGGIQLEWDSNGGDNITSVTPPNETVVQSCPTCSGGNKVGFVGEGGTLTFTDFDRIIVADSPN